MRPNLPESLLGRPIAHRALHDVADGRPENSRAAVRAAVEAGYGVEVDLQLTADGEALVMAAMNAALNAADPVNAAPTADAGPDAVIELPADTVTLAGMIGDDGFPAGSTLTCSISAMRKSSGRHWPAAM